MARVEERAAEVAIDEQHRQGGGQRREGEQDQQRRHEDVPGEDRHPEHVHPGRSAVVDRGDEVDRPDDAGDSDQHEPDDPQVQPDPWLVGRAAERDIARPACRCRPTLRQEPAENDQGTEQEQPERQRIEPRKRHLGRPDLEWHDRVRKADRHRRAEEQQHDRPVHREQLVEALLADQLEAGRCEFGPHLHRQQPAHEEHREGRRDVEEPDPLVVGRRQPASQPADLNRNRGRGRQPRGGDRPRRVHGAALPDTDGEPLPDADGEPLPGTCLPASQASYCGRVTARTVSVIRSWKTPQNSAHWPP